MRLYCAIMGVSWASDAIARNGTQNSDSGRNEINASVTRRTRRGGPLRLWETAEVPIFCKTPSQRLLTSSPTGSLGQPCLKEKRRGSRKRDWRSRMRGNWHYVASPDAPDKDLKPRTPTTSLNLAARCGS